VLDGDLVVCRDVDELDLVHGQQLLLLHDHILQEVLGDLVVGQEVVLPIRKGGGE